MRTLNVKSGNLLSVPKATNEFSDEKQPCWYADMEKADHKKDYKWKVGCKHDGKTEEYSFKVSKIGDVNDDKFWQWVTDVDFAVQLIDLFKQGGAKAVRTWIKNGCP